MYENADACWKDIPSLLAKALESAPRDFVTLECCANAPAYAKPDTRKWLLLWEVNKSVRSTGGELLTVEIDFAEDVPYQHPWLYQLFIQDTFVRFPFNFEDTEGDSLYWGTIAQGLARARVQTLQDLRQLPRFSTASRSNLTLIPENITHLAVVQALPAKERRPVKEKNLTLVNLPEWDAFKAALFQDTGHEEPRARQILEDLALSASLNGMSYKGRNYRLYSVKTGVTYVGSTVESKERLGTNSRLAMLRSKVIRGMPHRDQTFDIQTELLTVLAPLDSNFSGARDGFQVRDLSSLKPGLMYLPTQAIPYITMQFPPTKESIPEQQANYWRDNFAIPTGRAKALLFLKYGLIHTSANAQNFVLGFDQGDTLRHFVVRDIGDTSWHETYLDNCLRNTHFGALAWSACLLESPKPNAQTLTAPCTITYQSPRIVRLAAYSLLRHGFDSKLSQSQQDGGANWQAIDLYVFASGIMVGFRQYIEEALELKPLYPLTGAALDKTKLQTLGQQARYPYSLAKQHEYKDVVEKILKEKSSDLFAHAAYIQQQATTLLKDPEFVNLQYADDSNPVSVLINAEELYLCAGIEKLLHEWNVDQTEGRQTSDISLRIDALNGVRAWPEILHSQT